MAKVNRSSHGPRRGAAASIVFGLSLALVLASGQALAQRASDPGVVHPDTVGTVTPIVVNVDLRTLPPPPQWRPGMPERDNPRRSTQQPTSKLPEPGPHGDALLALQQATPRIMDDAFSPTTRNFDAFSYQGVNPPDPVGDVGTNYYITASNAGGSSVIKIYDKATPTPATLANTTMSAIAGGTGSCATGQGDPIVLYDQWADRWLLAEFASATSGNTLCIYMSQTSNPVSGGWYIYQLTTPTFPDYPKYGIWPNGDNLYTLTANESSPSAFALNRASMLAGAAMSFQRFTVPDLSGFSFQALTPADVDGPTAPAAATPAIFGRHIDNEAHTGFAGPGDYLQLWAMDIDWATPANSTFTALPLVQTSEFDSALCGLSSFYCMAKPGVAQGSGSSLDPLREVIMWRMAYRNQGAYQDLVGNLVTDVNGADRGGVRWFELRNPGTGWTLFQEGTYAPDVAGDPANVNRWMGSAAMDGAGNIAVAYSASAFTSVYPSLRYAGRRAACDPTGTLPLGENNIIAAAANNGSNRWGDYHSINIDPSDDCTFWFAGMYGGPTTGQWTTRVASFKFPNCGCTIPGTPTGVGAASTGANQIQVTWTDGAPAPASYKVLRAFGTCAAPTTPFTELATGVTASPYTDNTVSGGVTYAYKLTPVAADGCEACESTCAEATATGTCLLPPTFAGAASASSPGAATCQIAVAWNAGTATCSGPLTYNVYRSTTTGFTPSPANRVATGLVGTSYTDLDPLTPGTRYYYIVRAVDSSNGVEETNLVEKSAIPAGPAVLTEEFETGAAGWTTATITGTANLWALVTTDSHSPTHSEFCADIATVSANALVSPVIAPVAGSVLTFWHRFTFESGYDGGRLEVSTDGGTVWAAVPASAFLSGAYNGTISSSFSNPIAGPGWTATGGSLGNFLEVRVDMTTYAGANVRVRWVEGTDTSVSSTGWWVDSVSLTGACVPTPVELVNLSIQ